MSENDRTNRERTLTNDSNTSDKGRSRSFTEADKPVEKTSLKKTPSSGNGGQTADESATDKKVIVVGKFWKHSSFLYSEISYHCVSYDY